MKKTLASLLLSAAALVVIVPAHAGAELLVSVASLKLGSETQSLHFTPGLSQRFFDSDPQYHFVEVGMFQNVMGTVTLYAAFSALPSDSRFNVLLGGGSEYGVIVAPVYRLSTHWEALIMPPVNYGGVKTAPAVSVRAVF